MTEFYNNNKINKMQKIKKICLIIFIIIMIIMFIYIIINVTSLSARIKYDIKNTFNRDIQKIDEKDDDLVLLSKVSNNNIYIEKIDVLAPVTWNVTNIQSNTKKALKEGLIHIENTALPGEIGNVFITGHSSDYFWSDGKYKQVFALLDKLENDDKIFIRYKNNIYAYSVTDKRIVLPNDVSILEQGNKKILTLMTCTPVGTSLRRIIIVAKQYYPSIEQN